jgi:hypothetical protein
MEAAQARYLSHDSAYEIHRAMANYFGGFWSGAVEKPFFSPTYVLPHPERSKLEIKNRN